MYYEIKYPRTLDEVRRQHDLYLDERKVFDAQNGIIEPIRACVIDDKDGYYEATKKITDRLRCVIDILEAPEAYDQTADEYWKSISSIVGYFAAVYKENLQQPVLTYSLSSHQDIAKFDNEFGKLLAIHKALIYRDENNLKYLLDSHIGMSDIWLPDDIDNNKCVIFLRSPQEQAVHFIERCKRYYHLDNIPCLL